MHHPPPPTPPPPPTRARLHGAWYTAPAVLLLAALSLTGIGVLAGLFLTAGKHVACDSTTECAHTPYEPGYAAPAWPHAPFIAAAVCAALAVVTFVAILVVRRRGR
ncbi:hypothetical protein [Streptomyces sp. NPDC091371]|uniref:hypothetical protein n=1 Tax=Streptomyces sp. NPDC091371 TaxID=3155303 RepID=UPI00343281EE